MSQETRLNPEAVHDEISFLAFVSALVADRRHAAGATSSSYGPRAGWENDTIGDFLDAALAWAKDSSFGRSQGVDDDASVWRRVAIFLYCGKIYEEQASPADRVRWELSNLCEDLKQTEHDL